MRAYIIHSAKSCPERSLAVSELLQELDSVLPEATVEVLDGNEPGACVPDHVRMWCTGGSAEAVSRLLKHVDALNAAAAYPSGCTLVMEDDIKIDNAAALIAAAEGPGVVQLSTGATAYCLDSDAAGKVLAYMRASPKPADFQGRWKEALAATGVASRRVNACSDGSTVGRHTPSVRSGKTLADDFVGSASTLIETERLLDTYPLHPHASLLHAAKLKENGDFAAALRVCRAALGTFRGKPDGMGDTPLVRFAVALHAPPHPSAGARWALGA